MTVFAGIFTTFLLVARLILYALKHHPIPMGAFFFSLMVMATPLVMREEIKKWDTGSIICFAVALLVAYAITLLPPIQAPRALWMIFVVAAVAGGVSPYSRYILYLYFDSSWSIMDILHQPLQNSIR